jgi:hypothetical protein
MCDVLYVSARECGHADRIPAREVDSTGAC